MIPPHFKIVFVGGKGGVFVVAKELSRALDLELGHAMAMSIFLDNLLQDYSLFHDEHIKLTLHVSNEASSSN